MYKHIMILIVFLTSTLFGAPELKMFERFSKADGGPDTRGAIWYDEKHNNIFVADHGKGLWKIDECSNTHGDTSDSDGGLWDISHDKRYIYAVGKQGLSIYDEDGKLLNTLSSINGEGIYVKEGYAYIVNAGAKKGGSAGGIIVVNVKNINNPRVIKTVMSGKQFSQIRGGEIKIGDDENKVEKKLIYVSSLDGKLYLLETNGANVTYKDAITIFSSSEARKIFVGKKEMVYVNSNFGELAVVKVDKNNLKLSLKGNWKSSESHGKGQQAPAAGGVFVTKVKEGQTSKLYALITAADGNKDGYLYWLDVTNPSNIKKVDSLHDDIQDYGFNDIWVNDTRIYLAAHNGFTYMGMESARNTPVLSIKDSNAIQHAENIGDKKTFFVTITNNDNINTLDAKLKAPVTDSNWEYHYFDDDKDITEKITHGGYVLEDIQKLSSHEIKVEITPKADGARDAVVTIVATNKESKEICGKTAQSDEVSLKVTFNTVLSGGGSCYAMPDNDNVLYKMTMDPSAHPLPEPTIMTLSQSFNGEGAAYRAKDGKLYAFSGEGSVETTNNSSKHKGKKKKKGKKSRKHNKKDKKDKKDKKSKKAKKGKSAKESANDGASSNLYTIDITDGTITPVKIGLLPNQEVEAAEFYYDAISKKDIFYVITSEVYPQLHAFNTESWSELAGYPKDIVNNAGNSVVVAGLAIEPSTGKAYVTDDYDYDDTYSQLYTIDLKSGIVTWKTDIQGVLDAEGLAFADDGNLYVEDEGYDSYEKQFYVLNPETGTYTAAALFPSSFSNNDDIEAISCNGGESIVKKKDEPAVPTHFNVWDADEPIKTQVIKTKIVGEDIHLTFATLDNTGTKFQATKAKDIKVTLFNTSTNDRLTSWHSLKLGKATKMDVTFSSDDFKYLKHENEAFRAVQVFIQYKDSNGTQHYVTSSDSFAIRPDKFTISVPSSKKAAEPFTLHATTVGVTNVTVPTYNEQIDTSFKILHKEKKAICDTATVDLSGASFISGSLVKDIKYSEVGELTFTISEIQDYEFAIIDKNDTEDARRYITEANSSSIDIHAAGFEVTQWSLDDKSPIVYYSTMEDIEKMGTQLDVTVKAINADGNVTKNYRDGCYVTDTNLTVLFDLDGTSGQVNKLDWKDIINENHNSDTSPTTKVISPSINNSFNYDVISSSFTDGVSKSSLKINFAREKSRVKEPIKFTIHDINANNNDGVSGHLPQTGQVTDFYYGRLHVPNLNGTKKEESITVFYEVYCKQCDKTSFAYIKGNEIGEDSLYWYMLKKSQYDDSISKFDNVKGTYYDFGNIDDYSKPKDEVSSKTLSAQTNHKDEITFHISKLPFSDRIKYDPSPWLVYNRFNNATTTHSFNINISSKGNWSGKGKQGITIDDDISIKRSMKMNW